MPVSRAQREIELWRHWKEDPGPSTAEPLLNSLAKPVIYSIANQVGFGTGGGRLRIPRPVIRGIAVNQSMKLLENYDPAKSNIATYLNKYLLSHLHGELNKYRDIVRIPFGKVEDVGKVKEIESDLWEILGRFPSDSEIAAKLKRPEKHIRSIREQVAQKDYISSQTDVHTGIGMSPWTWAAWRTYTELPVQDKALWDMYINDDKSINEMKSSLNLSRRELERGLERIRNQFTDNLATRGEDAGIA